MQKRGRTEQHKQRWLCVSCTTSYALGHETQRLGRQLDRFVSYLLSNNSQKELPLPTRTWRQDTQWCWEIVPPQPVTGEIYPVLLMDGTRVGKQVCLIMRTPQYVASWSFAPWEASWSWDILLSTIPAPTVIVCDGQKGMLLSLARHWPGTRIQRCLFHIWQNLRAKLTLNPQTEAGIDLLAHYRQIWDMTTEADGRAWEEVFYEMYALHKNFLDEKTYTHLKTSGRRGWWYTHRNTRSAYRQIEKLLRSKHLFTHLDTELQKITQQPIPRTTNHMEGGNNSTLKGLLYNHRGMPAYHQQRLAEWYLYDKTEGKKPPRFCL